MADKIVFVSDLHGNMVATEAMAEEIKRIQPNAVYFLGDAIGKGPENHKACDWVKQNCTHFVRGNWDDGICKLWHESNLDHPDMFYVNQLGEERLRWLESLPLESEILISGISFRLIHGRPTDELYFGYDLEDKYARGFLSTDKSKSYGGFICADSHMPFVREVERGYVLNTGSVGNSLGIPKAHALLMEGKLDSNEKTPIHFTVLSVPYDNEKAALVAEDYPDLPNKEAYQNEVRTGRYSR